MKKLVIILMGMSACAYAQLEQHYQRGSEQQAQQQGNGDYYHLEPQPSCVLPIQDSNNVNTNAQQNDPQVCKNNPETCNCLNHGNGYLTDEPVRGDDFCVPVTVYEKTGEIQPWEQGGEGNQPWEEVGKYEDYQWCKDPENGSPHHPKNNSGGIDRNAPENRGNQGEGGKKG